MLEEDTIPPDQLCQEEQCFPPLEILDQTQQLFGEDTETLSQADQRVIQETSDQTLDIPRRSILPDQSSERNSESCLKKNNPIEDLLDSYTQRTDLLLKDWENSIQGSDFKQKLLDGQDQTELLREQQ